MVKINGIHPKMEAIFEHIHQIGGSSYFVGGVVRDHFLGVGISPKDFDVEVFGVDIPVLRSTLQYQCGNSDMKLNEVGASFGVFKVSFTDGDRDVEIDFSVPRRDNKIGVGHKDFEVVVDKNMSVHSAAHRRDFTVNAIYVDTVWGTVVDPVGGMFDLNRGVLRTVNNSTFGEDPLRILRAFQFLSRFPSFSAYYTLRCVVYEMIRGGVHKELPKERIWEEWKKWAFGPYSGNGLKFLFDSCALPMYPEIEALCMVDQDETHHPEGNVFRHTVHVLNSLCDVVSGKGDSVLVVKFAALCHDFGKVTTTELHADGRTTAYGHQDAGVEPTISFMNSIGAPDWLIKRVVPLVKEHMVCAELGSTEVTPRIVRRLANRLSPATIEELAVLTRADFSGRPPKPVGQFPAMETILKVASELNVADDSVKPIIMGRHLIDFGMEPDIIFKKILSACFEAQLDGVFHNFEEGRIFLRGYLGGLYDQ